MAELSEIAEDSLSENAFPSGVIIYYNLITKDGIANTALPTARRIHMFERNYAGTDYTVTDIDGNLLASIPREHVLCICPLITTGPADANSQS